MNSADAIVTQLLEDDDSVDPKDELLRHAGIKEITVYGRRWFDRRYGNTYHSFEIYVDGKQVHMSLVPLYGYDNAYLENAYKWLEEHGYVPRRIQSNGGHQAPWRHAESLGIKLTCHVFDVKLKREL